MKDRYTQIIQKRSVLTEIAQVLKTEFIGLDSIIDEIMSLLSPWYLFPEAQLRPTIINIWGLTGTGKTAMVKRITELLSMQEQFLLLDMGEFAGESGSWIKTMLTDDLEHFHEKSTILCLDEFQFARTLDNQENELTRDKMRVLWELFDSGKIFYEPQAAGYYVRKAEVAIHLISKCLKKGIELTNGEIIENTEEFLSIFGGYYFDCADRYNQEVNGSYFLSKDFTEGCKELFLNCNYSDSEINQIVKRSSLLEISDFLASGIKKELAIKQLDLSKSLIFILGNLDEAFYMSDELSPDLNADDFYTETLKVNIADIKTALKKRFRNEQIARLGNNHVIYPCFNSQGFRLLIQQQLDRISDYIKSHFGVSVLFDHSIIDVIYEEGVFPSQGIRPVITTIKQLIESNIGQIICFMIEQKSEIIEIHWKYCHLAFEVSFWDEQHHLVNTLGISPRLKLNQLRKPDNDDVQSHTAVHEAGHAIVAALALRILPSMIVTKTVSSQFDGFCRINLPERLITKGLLKKRIMISLAGYVSEKIVFGDDNTSSGVSLDLENATELANQAIKEFGMGSAPIRIHVATRDTNDFFFNHDKYEQQAMHLITECMKETEILLNRNKLLLLKMAQYLTEHSVIKEKAIGEMVIFYGTESWLKKEGFKTKDNYFNFKEVIQNQIEELETQSKPIPVKTSRLITNLSFEPLEM